MPKHLKVWIMQSEDSPKCDICLGSESDGQIVWCDGCNVVVHRVCYLLDLQYGVPAGDWFCQRCQYLNINPKQEIRCYLCPDLYGAFIQTSNTKTWYHITCVNYFCSVWFREEQQIIDGVEQTIQDRSVVVGKVPQDCFKLTCTICKNNTRDKGACIKCDKKRCRKTFHVRCGMKQGLISDYQEMEERRDSRGNMPIYCAQHNQTPKLKKKTRIQKRNIQLESQVSEFIPSDTIYTPNSSTLSEMLSTPEQPVKQVFVKKREQKLIRKKQTKANTLYVKGCKRLKKKCLEQEFQFQKPQDVKSISKPEEAQLIAQTMRNQIQQTVINKRTPNQKNLPSMFNNEIDLITPPLSVQKPLFKRACRKQPLQGFNTNQSLQMSSQARIQRNLDQKYKVKIELAKYLQLSPQQGYEKQEIHSSFIDYCLKKQFIKQEDVRDTNRQPTSEFIKQEVTYKFSSDIDFARLMGCDQLNCCFIDKHLIEKGLIQLI